MHGETAVSVKTAFILFGVTGDLARQKLIPSLYKLFVRGNLSPQFLLVGFGRKPFTQEEFRFYIEEIVRDVALPEELIKDKLELIGEFTQHCFYIEGQFDHGVDYERLKRKLESYQTAKAYFYLSVPPAYQPIIIDQLGWMQLLLATPIYKPHVLIEKPFGENDKSAKELDSVLKKYIEESGIYRIDHYLGKDVLHRLEEDKKNILFSHFWNDTYIEQIEATIHEKKDIGSRGAFYDKVGALKDVGQNHLLQMLSAIMVLSSSNCEADEVAKQRAKVLHSLSIIASKTVRGQYKGYTETTGIAADSTTETFFKTELKTSLPHWKKTRLIISAGKCLKDNSASLIITFRSKTKPVKKLRLELNAPHIVPLQRMDAYEHIFMSALQGNKKIFISLDEAVAGWKFVKKLHDVWKKRKTSLVIYKMGSNI
jgi:glucose-6-phosphate 1-dehydrogenase